MKQSSRFRVLWSRDVTSPQESLRWFWIQNHQDIWLLAFFFCLQLAASLPLCLLSYYFCYPVQPSSWWINGSPNRPWSLSSSLNPQERTLMDQQVPIPNNPVVRRWARLPWGRIWRGWGSPLKDLAEHVFCWGSPALCLLLETAFSFLAPCTVWITWSVLICHLPLWQQASSGLGRHQGSH